MRLAKRCAASVITTVVIGSSLPAFAATPAIELKVAKTDRKAFALGTVTPPRVGTTVRVRFFHDEGSGFVRVGTKKVTLFGNRDSDGDGARDSRFEAAFARPTTGSCKLVARFSPSSSDSVVFPCGIPEFGSGSATITSESGMTNVDLLIAETGEQQGYGLMYRRWLAPEKGMAFLFAQDTTSSFYMKNTLIPLSIAFFDSAGVIVRILDMEPCEEDPCPLYDPGTTYRGALEVNQGAFEEWGVTEGDIVQVTRD